MEPLKIDWRTIESVFIRDETYETINAPQWIDLLDADNVSVDDEAWFCRSDCKHPKTAQDFLISTPTSKLQRSVSISKLIGLSDWNWNREGGNLKRRGRGQFAQASSSSSNEENRNPNLATPHPVLPGKATMKSSAEKNEEKENCSEKSTMLRPEESRRLKSTLSARDLFGGRDIILGKITDLCNGIKRMATIITTKEEEAEAKVEGDVQEQKKSTELASGMVKVRNDMMPQIEAVVGSSIKKNDDVRQKPMMKKKPRGISDTENVPVDAVVPHMDLKRIIRDKNGSEIVRTSPPTPQGFSASNKRPPNNNRNSKSRHLKDREPFREVMQTPPKKSNEKLAAATVNNHPAVVSNESPTVFASSEGGRSLDIFWFFKPCVLSS